LIDCHRDIEGRKTNKNHLHFSSLDVALDNGEGKSFISNMEDEQWKSQEDLVFEHQVFKIVEAEFAKIKPQRKNAWKGDDMFAILMLHLDGFSYEMISEVAGCTQGTISNMINKTIMPKLQEIRQTLLEPI
jgi:hypothetical protein